LDLSTHTEKVQAVQDLVRLKGVVQLQTFLGMDVHFSAFMPYYSSIVAPLFVLLHKDTVWRWGAEEEYTFEVAKKVLREAPVLGHPVQRRPYQLYTDTSDDALGCALWQVQTVQVKDLRDTRAYDRLREAYKKQFPVPWLIKCIKSKAEDSTFQDAWGPSLDGTVVHLEQLIGYYSWLFKDMEHCYSMTKREVLGAKEA
jgi:hypothetical protein